MNRAWIPAGALAGVSVAGLIAMGPLTDSLSTQVPIPSIPQASGSVARVPSSVPVSINVLGASGTTVTAALAVRGGKAKSAAPASTSSASEGQVGYKVNGGTRHTRTSHATSGTASVTHAPAVVAKPKKTVKRPASIDGVSESNGDAGLTGGSDTTSKGEQSSTPGSSGP